MSEWVTQPLADVIELIGGGTPKTSIQGYWNGNIPWLSVVDFNTGMKFVCDTEKKITDTGMKHSSTKLLNQGDIIISARGTVGAMAVLAKPMTFNQSCYGIRGVSGQSLTDYVYYLVKDAISGLQQIAHGGVFDTITRDTFKGISISLPPLPEQKAIASVLSSLDDKIDLLHRQNLTLEAMAETLFRQWFVEEAQEDWEVVPFEQFFDFLEGPGIRNWQYTESGTPFINIRLISNGDIDISKASYVSNEEASGKYSHFHLKEGDMIVSTSGTLGKNAIVRSYHLPLLLNTSVIRFRPRDGRSYTFVYQYLNSRLFQEHLESTASGSVQANFGPTHLKQMTLTEPSPDVLTRYLEQADPIYDKIKVNQAQIKKLEKLRDTLLPKLMSGEVRVDYEQQDP